MEKLGKNARQAAVLVGDPQCAGWPCWGRRIVILRVVRWWRPWTRRLWWRYVRDAAGPQLLSMCWALPSSRHTTFIGAPGESRALADRAVAAWPGRTGVPVRLGPQGPLAGEI